MVGGVAVFAAWLIMWSGTAGVYGQDLYELIGEDFALIESPNPASPAGELQVARRALADRKSGKAIDLVNDWLDDHPNHPLLPNAYTLRGDAKAMGGNEFKALFDYEYVVRMYPQSELFHDVLEREFRVAQMYARGTNRKLWGMRIVPAGDEAEELYIRIQERSPGGMLAERSGLELADYYYATAKMNLAAEAYDLFQSNYPNSGYRRHAMKRQIEASLATFKGPSFDATGLHEAGRRIKDFEDAYPAAAEEMGTGALATRIDESIAEKNYEAANWYERHGKLVSARFMYKRVIRDHPSTAAAQAALDRLAILEPETFGGVEPEVMEPDEAMSDVAEPMDDVVDVEPEDTTARPDTAEE